MEYNQRSIRSLTNNSDNYDEKYMYIKFNSDEGFLVNKMLELYNIIIVIRSAFHECNKL